MKLRKNFLPRSVQDCCAFLFIILVIPTTFYFELFTVVPEIHGEYSKFHIFYFILGIFLLHNIVTNLLAAMMVDTSIDHELISPPPDREAAVAANWHLCTVCMAISPPRSFHCSVCNKCILKRDHHCMFAGYCIGFRNQRYFLALLVYLFVATTLCSAYNTYFIWWLHATEFTNILSYLKIIFPMMALVVDAGSTTQYYLLLYLINKVGAGITGTLLVYHGQLALRGNVVFEKSRRDYDLGWRRNLEMIFGERMHLVWISPFIRSPITLCDGIHWEEVRKESDKAR